MRRFNKNQKKTHLQPADEPDFYRMQPVGASATPQSSAGNLNHQQMLLTLLSSSAQTSQMQCLSGQGNRGQPNTGMTGTNASVFPMANNSNIMLTSLGLGGNVNNLASQAIRQPSLPSPAPSPLFAMMSSLAHPQQHQSLQTLQAQQQHQQHQQLILQHQHHHQQFLQSLVLQNQALMPSVSSNATATAPNRNSVMRPHQFNDIFSQNAQMNYTQSSMATNATLLEQIRASELLQQRNPPQIQNTSQSTPRNHVYSGANANANGSSDKQGQSSKGFQFQNTDFKHLKY